MENSSPYPDQENQEHEFEEEEETISLSDFHLTPDEHENHDPSPLLEKAELFEFSSYLNSNMSHAEDIINCGKLIPFKEQDQSPSQTQSPNTNTTDHHHKQQSLYGRRRRSESLTELKISSRSNSTKANMKMRNSRSLDYQKLSRNSSMSSDSPDINRNSSSRGSSRFDGSNIKVPSKPRWYVILFGSVKFPPEMNLQGMKYRQIHRTPSKPLFPSTDDNVKKALTNRKSSWGVLRVLSCRDDAGVNVKASLACIPHV